MQRRNNSDIHSKENTISNKTISQNGKINKGALSPSPNLFKTEITKKDFAFDEFNINKNNRQRFEKFEFDNFEISKK